MKYAKWIAAFLLAVLLLPATVYAAEESRKGSITVTMEYDGSAVTSGVLTAYQVARLENGRLEVIPPYQAGELDQENLTPELAETFAGQVTGEGIAAAVDGEARFENLELGLYLIVQTEASQGFEPLKPFLICVPMIEDGSCVFDVNAQGKFQLKREPDPPGPGLPQTGQLNWPIPVLAVLGLGLFSAGWMLCFGKKKDGHEK